MTSLNYRDLAQIVGYDPEQRLTLLANCGCLFTLVAFAAAFIAREDPLGAAALFVLPPFSAPFFPSRDVLP